MSGVLSKKLNYSDKAPHALPSESVMMKCLPVSGSTFGSGSTIRIMIPHRAGCYLKPDSYLSFTVNNGSTAYKIAVDGCVSALIQRLTVFQGSQLISDIQNYNSFKNVLLDTQVSSAQRVSGSHAIMMGTGYDYAEDGTTVGGARGGQVIAVSSSKDYSTVLVNAVLGSSASKYIPLGKLNDGIILEITLANFANAFIARATATGVISAEGVLTSAVQQTLSDAITINNVYFTANCVQLGDVAESLVQRMPDQGIFEIASKDWKIYNGAIADAASGTSVLLPARFQSVSTILGWQHEDGLQNNFRFKHLTSRSRNNLAQYSFRINGLPYPPWPVKCDGNGAQAYAELERTINSLTSTLHHISLTQSEWVMDDDGTHGAFVFGANLDTLAFAQDQPVFNGTKTSDGNCFVDLTFTAAGAAHAGKLYAAVQYDTVLVVDGEGNLSCRW